MNIGKLYVFSFSLYVIIGIFTFMFYGALPAILAKNNVPPQNIGAVCGIFAFCVKLLLFRLY